MSDLKTTEANDELKKQNEENEELKPEELDQVSGGNTIILPGRSLNHNQTCGLIG